MSTNRLPLKALAFGFLAFGSIASAGPADECLSDLGDALTSGGFTGSVDCRHDQLSIQEVGKVPAQRSTFTVYSYRYRLAPACADCAIHGGQRIIIMDGGRYIGQYKADFVTPSIEHGNLVMKATGEAPVTIAFRRNGPPDEILVDGEVLRIFK
ncbi:hypothetical protein [Novosphingobium sp. KA1]|uniref:hypothetical protein n=1 Tax=Novosphingobium sp. (strain KA1) TaxID=164608 RepID=UPI001A8D4152|nr:hypothetical protein [Novosphingobium sp. KA1]